MNKKTDNLSMIILLALTLFILSACGTLQVEQVEPDVSGAAFQAVLEEPELEETAVSSTPIPTISEPAPTAIPSTPGIEMLPPTAVTHNSNENETIVLPGCFDFDNGVSLTAGDPNCDFTLLPGPDNGTIEMYPVASSALAYGSVFPDAPTFAQCADNEGFSTESELVAPMAAMYVCYRTGEGRVGYLHFTEADLEQAYSVTLEWRTFSLEDEGGAAPGETNLIYQNESFGFRLPLPETWQGYEVTQNNDEIGTTSFCFTFIGSTPVCVLQIDAYTPATWDSLENIPTGYYLAENDQYVFAAGPFLEDCIQLDDFQCARYQEIPTILAGFTAE
jgi:hypothetical protein